MAKYTTAFSPFRIERLGMKQLQGFCGFELPLVPVTGGTR